MFERAKPRGQISAREMRRAGQLIDQARPQAAEGSAVFPFADAGGAVWADAGGDSFLALVTHVVTGSPGDPVKYGFAEQWPDPATGALGALPGGRKSDGTLNWALAVPTSETFAVDDLVRVRRHPRNANLYAAERVGGASLGDEPCGGSFASIPGYSAGVFQVLTHDASGCLAWHTPSACP